MLDYWVGAVRCVSHILLYEVAVVGIMCATTAWSVVKKSVPFNHIQAIVAVEPLAQPSTRADFGRLAGGTTALVAISIVDSSILDDF